ncbi:MAG: diguanylate cyclase [Dehalococcoidales bacterium]|nr:diguanylate cyclase [Dehalococcoidales bacterium]
MASHSIIHFAVLAIYVLVLAITLQLRQNRLKGLFLLYILPAAAVSLSALLVGMRQPYWLLSVWKATLAVGAAWAVVAYTHFTAGAAELTGTGSRRIVRIGYGWLAAVALLATGSCLAQDIMPPESAPALRYPGYVFNALLYAGGFFIVVSGYFLIRRLKQAAENRERTRLAFLLAGLGVMAAANIPAVFVKDARFTFFSIGLAANALIITSAMVRCGLLDIQKLVKKWSVYGITTVCITLAYLAVLLVLGDLLRFLPATLGIPLLAGITLLLAFLFNWLRGMLDRGMDRVLYGSRYLHRRMLLDFAGKLGMFINIEDIAHGLLGPLVKAIRAREAHLVLPAGDDFCTKFAARLDGGKGQLTPLALRRGGAVARWLENHDFLTRSEMESPAECRCFPDEEKQAIARSNLELLCPIVSKGILVGILAIGPRQPAGDYSDGDIDLVVRLARESAVAIENAQIYARIKEKADLDGMTGLYNHRAFQEKLAKQVELASVSGGNFSLLLIDLDSFKTYNDVYGHMLGDEILKEVGTLIRSSIRATDIGARYGGDEFAVILPGADATGAATVAERIRARLALAMEQKGIMLTCSIGVATWRTDGISREMLIQAADKALYAAKAAGKNCICLAGQAACGETVSTMPHQAGDDGAIVNIIYALAATVDTRDHYTYGHSRSVSRYASELATVLGYTKEGIKRIRAAGLLHDIGKLSIPDTILLKPGPLTGEEWEIVRHHPEMGVGILKYIVGLRSCVDAVLYHHERYDGTGYPRGLKGNDIPLDARILAIADAFDAMTSGRSYKERRMTEEEALRELERCSGTQFDPALVEAFISLRRRASSMLAGMEKG